MWCLGETADEGDGEASFALIAEPGQSPPDGGIYVPAWQLLIKT